MTNIVERLSPILEVTQKFPLRSEFVHSLSGFLKTISFILRESDRKIIMRHMEPYDSLSNKQEVTDLQVKLDEREDRIAILETRNFSLNKKLAALMSGLNPESPTKRPKIGEAASLQPSSMSTNEQPADMTSQLLILKAERDQLGVVSEARLNELNSLTLENQSLKMELAEKKELLYRIPHEYRHDTEALRHLVDNVRRYRKDLEEADATIKRLDREALDSSHRHKKLFGQFEKDLNEKYTKLDDFVKSSELELIRLRKDRDNMRQMYEQTNDLLGKSQKAIQHYQTSLSAAESMVKSQGNIIATIKMELSKFETAEGFRDDAEKLGLLEEIRANEQTYIDEIENLGQAFEQIQQENGALMKKISERDESISKLLAEKLKAEFTVTQIQKEAELSLSRSQKLDEISKHRVQEMEERESAARQMLINVEKNLNDRISAADSYKRKLGEAAAEISLLRGKQEQAASDIRDLKAALPDSTVRDQTAYEKRRLAEELSISRKKLDAYAASGVGIVKELEDELTIYKKLMKCTACQVRDKDAVILKCMHCFCKTCLDIRIETRQRKCPNCGESFGAGDIKQIYL